MIVAGIGCKKGAAGTDIAALVEQTAAQHGLSAADIGLMATGDMKRDEVGILLAALNLNIPLLVIDQQRLQGVADRCLSSSQASLDATGLPSLSETAALVAAGPGGKLLGPRIAGNGVTCALGITAQGLERGLQK